MFTGIIESSGKLIAVSQEGSNLRLRMQADFTHELKVDQSVAHNGICLTIANLSTDWYEVVAIDETIQKTTIGHWQANDIINLERGMALNARLDGHIVQGHVDAQAKCIGIEKKEGSYLLHFQFTKELPLLIEKGSITIDGISLTCFNCKEDLFSLEIIPYTWEHTNIAHLKLDQLVNIESDLIGRYFLAYLKQQEWLRTQS
jgi:riboflavin synthase